MISEEEAIHLAEREAAEEGWLRGGHPIRARIRRPLFRRGRRWVVELNPGPEGNSARVEIDADTGVVVDKSYLMSKQEAINRARQIAEELSLIHISEPTRPY